MGKAPLRRFEWDLPLPADAAPGARSALAAKIMIAVALLAALLVVLSPCALELTLYYTAIISCTVTEGGKEALASASAGKRRLYLNLGSFIAGFTLLYAASGATVGFIGEGVRSPMGEYGEIIPLLGGSLIVFFALKVAGAGALLRKLGIGSGETHQGHEKAGGLLGPLWRGLAALRGFGQRGSGRPSGMRARDSFLVGMGLSSACLSCMGGAVLYPLLVYAGITSWQYGLITLTLYSLGIAVPMVLIALGFFRIRLTLQGRLGLHRFLRFASAAMLAGIGLLILSGNDRVITDVAFWFLAEITSWTA
jgi:cytochrome c-type biogenesis protein